MLSRFQKNAIITGYVNSYCLVCDCYFDTDEATIVHMDDDENHHKQLLAHPYLEKYGDDHIRKVNKGYFCEFCSLLLATAAKVSLHIQEKGHHDRRGTLLLCRTNGAVIAFKDVVISEQAWHGVTDDTCALCNVEFDDAAIHRTEPGHLLNLVQNKVEFGPNNGVYRKTDDSSFQCLTCNSVFALNKMDDHFEDAQHKQLYEKCREQIKNHPSTEATTAKTIVKPAKETKEIAKVDKEAPKVQKDDESAIFAKENNITYNVGQNNAYCRLCNIKLPSSIRCMKEHVNGKEHKSRQNQSSSKVQPTESKPTLPTLTRRPFNRFMEHLVKVENILQDDVVVNEKYCVSEFSFLTVTQLGTRFRCQSCEVNLYYDDIEPHTNNEGHKRAMEESSVVTTFPAEFIREVRRDIFHCGYCNQVSGGWAVLTTHVTSIEHREAREAATWRLRRHLPDVRRHRIDQERGKDMLMKMFMSGRFF